LTQKSRAYVFKFLTPLTPSLEKTVDLNGFKYIRKPRNANVVFNQCGS